MNEIRRASVVFGLPACLVVAWPAATGIAGRLEGKAGTPSKHDELVGAVGALTIMLPGAGGGISISGERMYKDELWVPEQYWAWQDTTTKRELRAIIRVGDLEQATAPSDAPKKGD